MKATLPLVVAVLLTISARAENARLPYHQLYTIQKAQAELNRAHTNLAVVLTMQSTTPGVKNTDLAVAIDARAGKIPVEIAPEGNFAVPMTDQLLSEDPWVIVNQPRGTMKLDWRVGILLGRLTNTVHYLRLMGPVRDSEDVQGQLRQFFPNTPKMIMSGLKMAFPSDKKVTVIIHAKSGDRKLESDQNHEVIIPLVADLLQEDPEIALPVIPETVAIVSHAATN